MKALDTHLPPWLPMSRGTDGNFGRCVVSVSSFTALPARIIQRPAGRAALVFAPLCQFRYARFGNLHHHVAHERLVRIAQVIGVRVRVDAQAEAAVANTYVQHI